MTKRKVAPKENVRPDDAREVDQAHEDDDDRGIFEARTAFEELRHELIDVEAIAVAADAALEGLPFEHDRERRRASDRLYALVTATAAAASAALDEADEQLKRFSGDKRRRSPTRRDPPPRKGTREPQL